LAPSTWDVLLAVPKPADQDADADQAVADDHHHREHGVAGQRGRRGIAERDGRNQRDLDDGHRQRQQQGAKGLADRMGNHFGMVDGRKYRAEQDDEQHRREHEPRR
jgi:hypothetical protein